MTTERDLDTELDARMQRFVAQGMSRAGILAQLNLAGYPVEQLRLRFPEFPDVAFGLAPPTRNTAPAATRSRPMHPSSKDAPHRRVEVRGFTRTVRLDSESCGVSRCPQG